MASTRAPSARKSTVLPCAERASAFSFCAAKSTPRGRKHLLVPQEVFPSVHRSARALADNVFDIFRRVAPAAKIHNALRQRVIQLVFERVGNRLRRAFIAVGLKEHDRRLSSVTVAVLSSRTVFTSAAR